MYRVKKVCSDNEKYLSALSLCFNCVVELNLCTQKYILRLFEKKQKVMHEGIYDTTQFELECKAYKIKPLERLTSALTLDNLRASFKIGEPLRIQFLKFENEGSVPTRHECFVVFYSDKGEDLALITIRDITIISEAEELYRQNAILREKQQVNERYKMVVEQTGTAVFEWSASGSVKYISPEMINTFAGDYTNKDVLSVWYDENIIHPDDEKFLRESLNTSKAPSASAPLHVRLKAKSNIYVWCRLCFAFYYKNGRQLDRVIGMITNEDDAVSSRLLLEYRALYDTLTGVHNSHSFFALTKDMLRENPQNEYAVIRMDINHFKTINELYGIEEGDRVLRHVAAELEAQTTANGLCGRLYSDIFVMCIPYIKDTIEEFIYLLSKRISGILPGSGVNPYFGICCVEDRTTPTNVLCDRAGLALSQIKGSLLKNLAYYDSKLHAREIAERSIEAEMERALINGEFIIYLQPKHSLVSSKPIGAEALVRWNHPTRGLMSPASFIPLFEKNGFILKLDEFVWEEAFRLIRKWLDHDISPVPVSVNVSRMHIYDPNFATNVITLMDKYKVPGYLVELELTETTFVDNHEELYRTLCLLQEHGVNFSIDDFGSGYSSLNMLKNSPAGILKLDREFLCAAADNDKAQTVVRHTISMANQLNMQVVAEGVENEEQAKFLVDAGCLAAQGFFYSKPMPIVEFEKLMLY